ncbi:FAS1 domain-containing protein, partial [Basidiobolus meristosporus CBS 931.73]
SVLDLLAEDNRFYDFMDVLSKERGLTDDLQDNNQEVTVFAPTNQAFQKLRNTYQGRIPRDELRDAVRYHFIPEWYEYEDLREEKLIDTQLTPRGLDGESQKIRVVRREGHVVLNNLVSISEADLEARNGIVHAVDEVLLPPPKVTDLIYRMANKFSTFSAALQRTGLNEEFEGESSITAFVPTNAAFRKLGCRALNYLFSEEGEKDLRRVLEYHFSPELVYGRRRRPGYDDITELPSFLRGEKLYLEVKKTPSRRVFINVNDEARVIFSDIPAENGVFHAIDEVLLPENLDIPEYDW